MSGDRLGRTMTRDHRLRLLLPVGLVLLVAALPLSLLVSTTSTARRLATLSTMTADALRPSRWEAVAVAGQAVKPGLIVIAVAVLAGTVRRSPRSAGVFALVVVMTNVTVQGAKHLPFLDQVTLAALNPLSGHAGLAAGVGLGLVVVVTRLRALVAVAAATVFAGVGAGVVLAGWHTMAQVVCPLAVGVGWSLVGASLTGDADGRRGRWGRREGEVALGGAGGLMLVGVAVVAMPWSLDGGFSEESGLSSLVLQLAVIVGSSLAALSAVVLASVPGAGRVPRPVPVPAGEVVVGPNP